MDKSNVGRKNRSKSVLRQIMDQYEGCDITKRNNICSTINMWGDINELPTITKYYMYKKCDTMNMSKVNYSTVLVNMDKKSIDNLIDNYKYELNNDINDELDNIDDELDDNDDEESNRPHYDNLDTKIIADNIIKEQHLKLYLILREKKICKPLIKYIIGDVSKYEYYKFVIHCGCNNWEILMNGLGKETQKKILVEAKNNITSNIKLFDYDVYDIYTELEDIKNNPLKITEIDQTYMNIVMSLKGNPSMWIHIDNMTLDTFMYILEQTDIHIGHIINIYETNYLRQAHICNRIAERYPNILLVVEDQPESLIMSSLNKNPESWKYIRKENMTDYIIEHMINDMNIYYDNIKRYFKIIGNEKFMTYNVINGIQNMGCKL